MRRIACVQFHPTDSNLAVAGGGWGSGEAWWTDNGGTTWHLAKHAVDWVVYPPTQGTDGKKKSRVEIAYALKHPKIVYALVDTSGGQIWKSIDGGKSYVPETFSGGIALPVPLVFPLLGRGESVLFLRLL